MDTSTTTLTYQEQRTYFYLHAGSQVPVAVTVHAISDTSVSYVIADGAADPFRLHSEPKWLFERGIQNGAETMRRQMNALHPTQRTLALLYARLRAVLDVQRMLTQEEAERVGHLVKLNSGAQGIITFAHRDGDTWRYFIGEVRGGEVRGEREYERREFTPLTTFPGDAMPEPVPAPKAQEPQPIPAPITPPAGPLFELPALPPVTTPARRSEYKGFPTLTLTVKDDKEFSFGRAKAVAILQNLEAIIQFVNDTAEKETQEEKQEPDAPKAVSPSSDERERMVKRFRQLADGLENAIQKKGHLPFENANPTYRRQQIRMSAAADWSKLVTLQSLLYRLADAWENGTIPASLKKLSMKAHVEYLMNNHTVPTAYIHDEDLQKALDGAKGKPGITELRRVLEPMLYRAEKGTTRFISLDEALAAEKLQEITTVKWSAYWWGLDNYKRMSKIGLNNEAAYQAARADLLALADAPKVDPKLEIQNLERQAMLQDIPGFFPTPLAVGEQVMQAAGIEAGMSVLEPSAGSGRLADLARSAGGVVECVEIFYDLRTLLEKKSHRVIARDFMEETPKPRFDRVVMNPPFEQGQDIEHVQRAFEWLKPGGRLVAIMSEGPFFRSDRKAEQFRTWLDAQGGHSEQLPVNSFKESGTGVATRLVVVER